MQLGGVCSRLHLDERGQGGTAIELDLGRPGPLQVSRRRTKTWGAVHEYQTLRLPLVRCEGSPASSVAPTVVPGAVAQVPVGAALRRRRRLRALPKRRRSLLHHPKDADQESETYAARN